MANSQEPVDRLEVHRLEDGVRYVVPPVKPQWDGWQSAVAMVIGIAGLTGCLYVLWSVDAESLFAWMGASCSIAILLSVAYELFWAVWNPARIIEVAGGSLSVGWQRGWLRWVRRRPLRKLTAIHLRPERQPYGNKGEYALNEAELGEEMRQKLAHWYRIEAQGGGKPLSLLGGSYERLRRLAEDLQEQIAARGVETSLTEAENRWVEPQSGRARSSIEQQPRDSVFAVEATGNRLTLIADKAKWVGTGNDLVLVLPSVLLIAAAVAWNYYGRDHPSPALNFWTAIIAFALPFVLAGAIRLIRPKRRIRIELDESALSIEEPGFLEFLRRRRWPIDALVDIRAAQPVEVGSRPRHSYLRIATRDKVHRVVRLRNQGDVAWAAAVLREACGLQQDPDTHAGDPSS